MSASVLPAQPAQAERVIAGRYRLAERLGAGGAATVYRAFDLSEQRWLALKLLSPDGQDKLLPLFQREYHTLAGLDHPNIVRAFEYGIAPAGTYYTMELLAGADLSREVPLPWERACKYVAEAATALSVLHARKLLHRDISSRNLWRTPDDAIKLIDFGALSTFGPNSTVVGTPPCIAPEALSRGELDQRADLYALGAVLYWLVTGVHAFPARSLADLPGFWAQPVKPASQRVAAAHARLPPIPAELDALLESLLSQNPAGRPSSAAEVVERLRAIAVTRAHDFAEVRARVLPQGAFIGRTRQKRALERRLTGLLEGQGSTIVIESRHGDGRSRLLRDFGLTARITGTTVLELQAAAHPGVHGLASALTLRLLDALPEVAGPLARERGAVLGHLSNTLRERLGVGELPPLPVLLAGEARSFLHGKLTELFQAVAAQRPLVCLIDDVELGDEASLAWLLWLAEASASSPILLVCASCSESGQPHRSLRKALRQSAHVVRLAPFTREETQEQLASVFGDAPLLLRFCARVYAHSHGNLAENLAIAAHLFESGAISLLDGLWVLPQELSAAQLSRGRADNDNARLAALGGDALALARSVSVCDELLTHELARELSGLDAAAVSGGLDELVRAGLLSRMEGGHRFARTKTREALYAALPEDQRDACHVRYGRWLERQPGLTAVARVIACVHLLRGPAPEAAERTLTELAMRLAVTEPDQLGAAVAGLEQALEIYRRRGYAAHELLPLLLPLVSAGYYYDRRLAERYGSEALATAQSALRLDLAVRLRPYLGRKLALFAALGAAGVRFRRLQHNPRVPALRDALVALFACVATLTGVHTICIDPERALETAQVLEPLTGLGEKHTATLMYQFAMNLATTVQDRVGEAHARWKRMIEQLERPEAVPWLEEQLRIRYLNGGLYALGVLEAWRDSTQALQIAERLEASGISLYQMSADQVRAVYYANQGNVERYEHYRARAELHAIKRGSAWQVEVWAPMAAMTPCLRLHDVMQMKHALEQLERLAKGVRGVAQGMARARGAYELLRKHHEAALPYLEAVQQEKPRFVVGWARSRGILARCYNALGRHGEARAVCLETLAQLAEEDLSFVALNLGVQIELVFADAGLGQHARALAQLDQLDARYASSDSPLTRGALAEARTRIQLAHRDEPAVRAAFAQLQHHYAQSGAPSLIARSEQLARQIGRTFKLETERPSAESPAAFTTNFSVNVTAIDHALCDVNLQPVQRQEKALQLIVTAAGSTRGSLWLVDQDQVELAATLGAAPDAQLSAWVVARVQALTDQQTTITESLDEGTQDLNLHALEGARHRVLPLECTELGEERVIGAVVLEEHTQGGCVVSPYLLQAVARRLRAEGASVTLGSI